MTSTDTNTAIRFGPLALRVGDYVAVKGDTGKKGKLRYERWYAEIKGFALEEDLLEEGTDEIDVSHLPGTAVTVCWFHAAEEPLKLMPVTTEDGDLTMMRRALCEEAYLFGDVICEIAISTITGLASPIRISELQLGFWASSSGDDFLCRWMFHEGLESCSITAEKWCTDGCKLNRFWEVEKEVMWFCTVCQFWYHFDCCRTKPLERPLKTMEDFIAMPLLKGGPIGSVGTSPSVFFAAEMMKRLCAKGGVTAGIDFRTYMDGLDYTLDDSVEQMLQNALGWINTDIECPKCAQQCP